jgi:hypothetical protein
MDTRHVTQTGLDERSADFFLRQAYLHRVRGELSEALRALSALLELDPQNVDAVDMKRAIEQEQLRLTAERKEAELRRGRTAAMLCRIGSIALVIAALMLMDQATDPTGGVATASTVYLGLRLGYWYALAALGLLIAAAGVWLLRYRWIPDWADLETPDPEYTYRWSPWTWWWWW